MSVKQISQDSAAFGTTHGKTGAFNASALQTLGKTILALGGAVLVINEIRGLILAAPILYGMAQANSLMALWVGFCSLVRIAASVLVPAIVWRKLR